MRIEIRNDSVILDGYVNAVERFSKPIPSIKGKFIEQIEARAFDRALGRAQNVDLLLNHDPKRKLGSTNDGNLQLFEDNIGLRAICTVTDPDVMEKAKNKQLRGWSFGFYSIKDDWQDSESGIQRRTVKELDIFEVSIVDNTKNPAYSATSIEMRDEQEVITENRCSDFQAITVDESIQEPEQITDQEERTEENLDLNLIYEKRMEFLKLKAQK